MSRISSRQGRLFIIVGPSGSGKDTIINGLKQSLGYNNRIKFVQRVVTRPVDPSLEDHLSVSEAGFERAKASGNFAVTWQAHGLHYAIPADVLKHIASGGIAIANGSRRALKDIAAAFPDLVVINIVVEREALHKRLLARGRECEADILKRLDHASLPLEAGVKTIDIDNSGPVHIAVERLLGIFSGPASNLAE